MRRCSRCNEQYRDASEYCPRCGAHRNQAAYEPTQTQIRTACRKIQSGWSRDEEEGHRVVKTMHADTPRARKIGPSRRRKPSTPD